MKKPSFFCFLLCFIFQCAQTDAQNFEWAKVIAGTGDEVGRSIAVDANGNVYTTGFFDSIADLDPGSGVQSVNAFGNLGVYIQKLDSLGNLVWAKSLSGPGGCWGVSLKVDTAGNVYVTGEFSDTLDFDPGVGVYDLAPTLPAFQSVFILKLDSFGNFVWAKNIGSGVWTRSAALDLDLAGNVFLTGNFYDSIDLDPGPGTYSRYSPGGTDIYIVNLDAAGNFVWGRTFGSMDSNLAGDISVGPSGNVCSIGSYRGNLDCDPGPGVFNLVCASADPDIYVLMLDPSGNFLWAKRLGSSNAEEGNALATDPLGNVYITGAFSETVDFDPGAGVFNMTALGSPGIYDIFIEKLDVSGNFIWAKSIAGAGYDIGKTIALDSAGYIYISGFFSQPADFDPGPGTIMLNTSGAEDIFIEKLDASGNFVWAGNVGGGLIDEGLGIAIDASGNVFGTGRFESFTDFDPGAGIVGETSSGATDAFVLKWSQDICANMALVIDSATGVSCSAIGYASSHTVGGLAPYAYTWNTLPVANDSINSFTTAGIYQLTVTDANSCVRSTSLLINAPGFLTDFDLEANMVATTFRPGFPTTVTLDGFNDGCLAVTGTMKLVVDNLVNFISSSPAPDVISLDTLIWNFNSLTYDSGHLTPTLNFVTDTTAPMAGTVCFELIISPFSGDADSSNNVKNYCFTVLNGYDPNDKQVYPKGECNEGYILNDQLLTYTVRFQNTGNADAVNIAVLDSLDADLDLNTLRVIGSSHPLITEVLAGNVLKFRFDNILLPDSASNETGSHGYVIYEISPLPALASGTAIRNKAEIYFDFNPAIVTNFVTNTIISVLPSELSNAVTQSGNVLTAVETGATYQWINCANGALIAGASSQSFAPLTGGNYSVVVSNGGCSVSSGCYSVLLAGLNENEFNSLVNAYPNPTSGAVSLEFGAVYGNVTVEVYDVFGRLVSEKNEKSVSKTNIGINGANGIYFLMVTLDERKVFLKVVKN